MKRGKIERFLINQTDAAELLGVERPTVAKQGFRTIERGRALLYDIRELHAWGVQRASNKAQKTVTQTNLPGTDIEKERLRLTTAQADAQELKNEIARAEVVPCEFATYTLSRVANEAAGILDSLPLHIQRRHPETSTKLLKTIRRELSKSMNALSAINETALPGIIDEYINQEMVK